MQDFRNFVNESEENGGKGGQNLADLIIKILYIISISLLSKSTEII